MALARGLSLESYFFQIWSFFKERTPAGPPLFGDVNKSSCHVLQPGSGRHISPLTWHQVNWRPSPNSSFCKGSSVSHSCQWHITLVRARMVSSDPSLRPSQHCLLCHWAVMRSAEMGGSPGMLRLWPYEWTYVMIRDESMAWYKTHKCESPRQKLRL